MKNKAKLQHSFKQTHPKSQIVLTIFKDYKMKIQKNESYRETHQ